MVLSAPEFILNNMARPGRQMDGARGKICLVSWTFDRAALLGRMGKSSKDVVLAVDEGVREASNVARCAVTVVKDGEEVAR